MLPLDTKGIQSTRRADRSLLLFPILDIYIYRFHLSPTSSNKSTDRGKSSSEKMERREREDWRPWESDQRADRSTRSIRIRIIGSLTSKHSSPCRGFFRIHVRPFSLSISISVSIISPLLTSSQSRIQRGKLKFPSWRASKDPRIF